MPKITISEQDLTTANIEQLTNNIAYVPGYAIMGPINTPTLCTTLSSFQAIFGKLPYKFNSKQEYPAGFMHDSVLSGNDFAFAGDFEKSYIYAAELLNNGLPIIFERVMNAQTADTWVAKTEFNFVEDSTEEFIISAKNPGRYGTFISYEITQSGQTISSTINVNLMKTQQKSKLYEDAACQNPIADSDIDAGSSVFVGDRSDDAYMITFGDKKGYMRAENLITTECGYLSVGSVIKRLSRINGEEYVRDTILDKQTPIIFNDMILAGSQVSYGSVLSGTYTENESEEHYDNTRIESYDDVTYDIKVMLDNTTNEAVEYGITSKISRTYKVSFNPSNPNYFRKIESDIVTFNIPEETKGKSLDLKSLSGKLAIAGKSADEDEFTVAEMYKQLSGNIFDKLTDRGDYQLKFITSGSYPVFEYNTDKADNAITNKMLKVAAMRGDAVALIDYVDNPARALAGSDDNTTLYYAVQNIAELDVTTGSKIEDARKYGAMFAPWAMYLAKTISANSNLPASFAYLLSLSNSIKTNANWYAVAGVTRGLVPNLLSVDQNITGAMAEELQSKDGISINPIVMIKPYGYCIWGNRTLNKNEGLVASSFLNIRALTNDVKKVVYETARKLTFELNSDILWLNFKAEIEPTLDKMVSGNGLTNYKILRKATNKRATIEAVIRLYAVEAIEDWDITIELADNYISVE